jgi:hypothetical protein
MEERAMRKFVTFRAAQQKDGGRSRAGKVRSIMGQASNLPSEKTLQTEYISDFRLYSYVKG